MGLSAYNSAEYLTFFNYERYHYVLKGPPFLKVLIFVLSNRLREFDDKHLIYINSKIYNV